MTDDESNGWPEWKRAVLQKLDDLDARAKRIEAKQDRHSTDIATLKVKSGIWGALAAVLTVALAMGLKLL